MTPVSGPVFDPAFQDRLRELLRWRRDVRRFRADALPPGELARLIEVASLAPSVGLSQPWRFVTVDDAARRAAVRADFARCNAAALAAQPGRTRPGYARLKLAGLDEAPCHLAIYVDPGPAQGGGLGRATMPETAAYSAVLAAHTLWLAARARGVGMGWVSILDPHAVSAALDAPLHWRLIGYFCLGYPAEPADEPELQAQGWERRILPVVLAR